MSASAPSLETLRMAAMLLDTARQRPRMMSIVAGFGAKKISEIPEDKRAEAVALFLEAKMGAKHAAWLMMK